MNIRRSVKKLIPTQLFDAVEPYGHLAESVVYATKNGFPGRKLRIIGVTGTNGKTTTSFMIHRMLVDAGINAGLMTTVAYGIGNDITPQAAHVTTLAAPALQARLKEFADAGVEWVVLETTSHALAQHRAFVPFEVAVITNITHEHLDYHKTFARYIAAKRRLFEIANRKPSGFGIANADDPNCDKFISAINHFETYGIENGQLRAENVQLSSEGSRYRAKIGEQSYDITCKIPGEFNVSNSLAAVSVGRHLGLSKAQIEGGIAALDGVEGRMNTIDEGQPYSVIVDFAHTPDSFERLLSDLRKSTAGKLIVLFGSAGRRDETKRAVQGEIAGNYADEVILTEEDDRDIDGNEILKQIASGVEKAGKIHEKNLFLKLDRTDAINFAVTRASEKNDTVVLLGKGHEKTIERADGEHPWDEVAVAKAAIRSAKG